jgi:hypothetical protein
MDVRPLVTEVLVPFASFVIAVGCGILITCQEPSAAMFLQRMAELMERVVP